MQTPSFLMVSFRGARLAKLALDRAANCAVDTADLLAADDFRQRRSDHGSPADDL